MKNKKPFDLLAKEINYKFHWENVHKAMMATNWCWHLGIDSLGQDNKGVPSIETIQNHAFALLKKAYNLEHNGSISAGGFTAGWDDGELYLTFTLESCSA
jgi:hypothetical protein